MTGYELLQTLDLSGKTVIADRGYDMNRIVDLIQDRQAIAVIPSRKNRKVQRSCDWWLYKERHRGELLFNRLKHYRRLATRYDKLACSFMAPVPSEKAIKRLLDKGRSKRSKKSEIW